MKSFPEKPGGKLKPDESTIAPWRDITTDFVTGLPEANLVNSKEVINNFHKSKPSVPCKLYANVFEGLVFRSFENLCEPVIILSHLEVET